MVRDLRRLADTRLDLLVVGAGFYGAAAAWDAALRGLSVGIIDKGDFGAGTSFNNFKILHGGLRSLQSLNLRQMRLFIRERRALARVAPHLVQPVAFVVPTSRHPLRSRSLMRVALALNDVIARDRHRGLADPAVHLPPSRTISREECLRLNPLVDARGVTGGAVWYDYQMPNTDRMTLSFILSAVDKGAVAANYVRATALLRDGARIAGVRARDEIGGSIFDIRARTVLNAAGPWAESLLASCGIAVPPAAPCWSRAMNLVTRPLTVAQGCGGRARGRFLFVVPWRDAALVGTAHDPHAGGPDALAVTRWDLEAFLADIRDAFPHAGLTLADVRLVHRGLLPAQQADDRRVRLLRESVVIDHSSSSAPGLISMIGVRYTTARHTAARAIDAVFRVRGETPPPSRTDQVPVVGGAISDKDRFLRAVLLRTVPGTTDAMLGRLARTYGTAYDAVLQTLRDHPELAQPLGPSCAVTGAEIVHAVRHESAVTLSDALLRRTEAGSAGYPGRDAVVRAATLMANCLGWDAQRARDEIDEVEAFYRIPGR